MVYGVVFKVTDFNAYVVYLGTGLVVWNAMAAAIQSAPSLFRNNASNLKNTNIHPIFYSLEEWAFQAQTFFQSFGLVLLVLMLFQPSLPLHLVTVGLLPLLNILLFIYWFPLLLCLLGAHYEDFFQLVPIALQLMFLMSPILYKKEALGNLGWTAELNPLYLLLSNLRHSLVQGELQLNIALIALACNLIGVVVSAWCLQSQRRHLPFLV